MCILNIKRSKIPRSWTKVSPASAFLPVHKEPRSFWNSSFVPFKDTTLNIRSVYKKNTVLPECSSFLPFRDTILMYDPYAEILPWRTIRMHKEHRSSAMPTVSFLPFRDTTLTHKPYVKIRIGKSGVLVRESGSVSKWNGSSTLAKRTTFLSLKGVSKWYLFDNLGQEPNLDP